jgi:hypothetical protein
LLSTAPAYLVKGLIPAVGLIVIWGPPKCGKSFWASDMALHVALGRQYRSRKVKQGAVVYLVLEGDAGFKARATAWRQRHLSDDEDPPFFEIATRIDLVADHKELIRCIRTQLPDGIKPALVVVDTVNRSLAGSESSDEDMGRYIKAADAIREAFGGAVAVIHHCGIAESRPRGHTSLTGAADAQISVKRDEAKNIVVTLEYMKDGPEGDMILSRLEQVEVALDDEGDPITSCVIEPVEGGAAVDQPVKTKTDKPESEASILRKAFNDGYRRLADAESSTPGLDGRPVRKVKIEDLRNELLRRGHLKTDDTGALTSMGRQAFFKAKTSMFNSGAFVEQDGLVWSIATERL